MKKIIFLVLLLSNFFGHAQYTLIPDMNFEYTLISLGIDSGSIDGKVLTTNVSGVTALNVSNQSITNLTGIQDFLALTNLECHHNQLTHLDVSKNTSLVNLVCDNNRLTSLDVSKNTSLDYFWCNSNQLTSLDISNNINLTFLNCTNNNLLTLNLKNGKNTSGFAGYSSLFLKSNPNLKCIQVDNKSYSDSNWSSYKDAAASYSENCSKTTAVTPPVITATGNQIYCPGTSINVVETINITPDPAEPVTDAIYIQVSTGYVFGQDLLFLSNATLHPTITASWDPTAGKLKLYSPAGIPVLYADFVNAIKDVQFSNSGASPSGIRKFSITIGQANYLPSTGHYYLFISNIGITWTDAKVAAETSTYFGLQGYLATILAADEAQISGEQASGAGWIGGSDAANEGEWKWVTGPENGIVFWNGGVGGSTPNFAFWNSGEPNNLGNENYAHVTAPGVGVLGSWNDLSNTGNASGNYQPKGYIVEYGGMPGDPILQISASTTITVAGITGTTPSSACGSGAVNLQATATAGTINWYDATNGGNLVATGNSFTTPILTSTTTYYVDAGCLLRTPIIATINAIPTITSTNSPVSRCGAGSVTLQASSTIGTINWYATATGTIIEGTGNNFTISNVTANTTYYAEAFNNGCSNGTRTAVDVKVYTPPVVVDQEVTKCKSKPVTLDALLSGMSYLWSTGETTQQITVPTLGIYTVDVTSPTPQNCTSRKTITVVEHNIPEIDRVDVNETTVVIYLKQEESYYEFSIDGINYQKSNVFFNVQSGLQTAYVREMNSCSIDFQSFIVIIIPKFFTPNNDSYNDLWLIKGLIYYPKAEVSIFDRYGKLLKQLNANNLGWDGMFNGFELPSSDYWYALKIDETQPITKGHFSLKR